MPYRTPSESTLPAALLKGRWWRKFRGGHWELVNFDLLHSPFSGIVWMKMPKCSRLVLSDPRALICCEEHR